MTARDAFLEAMRKYPPPPAGDIKPPNWDSLVAAALVEVIEEIRKDQDDDGA